MIRDWHATYLTCPTVHAAARERCAATGEDGWAAAAMLARTMPPGFGHYEAAGARAVIAPSSELDEAMNKNLHFASLLGSECVSDRSSLLWPSTLLHESFCDRQSLPPSISGRSGSTSRGHNPGRPFDTFTCPRCGATSRDPDDIVNRYCGRCHVYVDDADIEDESPWLAYTALHDLLTRVRAGELTVQDASTHPAISDARRRRLVVEPSPALNERRRGAARGTQGAALRLHLTELGRVELRRLVQRGYPA
jgi:hypothetical protein